MHTIQFWNFGAPATGRVVTSFRSPDWGGSAHVVRARNPHGGHSLLLVAGGEARVHGTRAVLHVLQDYPRAFRRALRIGGAQ